MADTTATKTGTDIEFRVEIADGRLVCSAEGDLRRFIIMGMQFQPSRFGGKPTLEEFGQGTDVRLADEANRLIAAGHTWDALWFLFVEHAEACDVCGHNLAKQRELREDLR